MPAWTTAHRGTQPRVQQQLMHQDSGSVHGSGRGLFASYTGIPAWRRQLKLSQGWMKLPG